MSITISSNISSAQANRSLNNEANTVSKNFQHQSSGSRITRASDDPAGLAVALSLLSDADLSNVASRNLSDAVSITSIADGALENAGKITDRMSELATQAANGTLSASQRSALNNEYQQLSAELDRISQTTEFNDQKLLSENNTISLQAGTDSSSSSQMMLALPSVSAKNLGLPSDISTQENAQNAIDSVSAARDVISQTRGQIGAVSSRFDSALNNLSTNEINQREAASRISDLDMAESSASMAASKIREQAAAAMSAQANQLPSLAMQLIG